MRSPGTLYVRGVIDSARIVLGCVAIASNTIAGVNSGAFEGFVGARPD